MNIDPVAKVQAIPGQPVPVQGSPPATVEGDSVDLTQSEILRQQMDQAAAVRADKVARAKELINSKDYPSSKVLGEVARLLADQLQDRHQ